ncbi:helix-turn-helix transcriptional regulator [Streptomyces antimicrobicus]|uniref:LuxR C-terminal-related transcriptional regulator n=1 Tax=Streptomyces antimicrobicus TaxID=2883108 RepID=A0ABS8B199_9ACTN|nr:LuxR family transcriptional regulator [Streptomyces antimicrobicus]MCB5178384.1 LuxR C-terminal-related transcriptional regulator [Streptomyces antimicrobicus]
MSLGLSPREETVYRHFLRSPRGRPETLGQRLGISREEADEALRSLCRYKLLRVAAEGRVVPIDPVLGIERLIEQRLEELNEQLRQVASVRSVIPELVEQARAGDAPADTPPSGIERIDGLDEIRARLDDLAFFARKEMFALQPDGPLTPAFIEAARPLDLRCIRRGITLRTVVLRTALEDPATRAYLHEMAELGAEFRTVEKVMDRMVIYDRATAVVPLDPSDSARGALLVRQSGLVSNMVALFEKVWASAEPLPGRDAQDTADGITDTEREVLTLLTLFDKDEIAAREMGISIRTFRRHVAELLLRLGASNRFQAAVLAKERGWM